MSRSTALRSARSRISLSREATRTRSSPTSTSNSDAPIDKNTRARLETQGLTGGAVVALLGAPTAGPPLVGGQWQAAGHPRRTVRPSCRTFWIMLRRCRPKGRRSWRTRIKSSPKTPRRFHSALANVDQFSKALADNSAGVDAALKSVGELGKQIGPLAARLQTLSDDADRLVQAVDTESGSRDCRKPPGDVGQGRVDPRSRRQARYRQFRFHSVDTSQRRCLLQGPCRQCTEYRHGR